MNKVLIEMAKAGDVRDIVALIADDEAGLHTDSLEKADAEGWASTFEAIDNDPRNELYVARDDAGILGTLQITFIPYFFGDRALVEGMFVAQQARGQGIGSLLLDFACELAKERGCSMVQLHSNRIRARAHRFYEQHGFEASHYGFKREI